MSRKTENTGFVCEVCGEKILPLNNGSFRNHCPYCLYSKHMDIELGDRQSKCNGMMKPIGIVYGKKGYQIIHECTVCKEQKTNRIAENSIQSDDIEIIIKLMRPY